MEALGKNSGMRFLALPNNFNQKRLTTLYLSFPPVKADFYYVFVTHTLYWEPSGAPTVRVYWYIYAFIHLLFLHVTMYKG